MPPPSPTWSRRAEKARRARGEEAARVGLDSARPMAIKLAVLSQKGGTGKTTAVRHLADAFQRAGLEVLVVDLDPQGNLSDYFDVDPEAEPTIRDVLVGQAKARAATRAGGEGVEATPATPSLAEAEVAPAGKRARDLTLRRALKPIDG